MFTHSSSPNRPAQAHQAEGDSPQRDRRARHRLAHGQSPGCRPLPTCALCPLACLHPRYKTLPVVHSSGGHTLLRGTPTFQQAPTSFASVALRYGRRCSSPQTPQLTGCASCTAALHSARPLLRAPGSPRLTSSSGDHWSAFISKNHRTQSVGAAVPARGDGLAARAVTLFQVELLVLGVHGQRLWSLLL
ncbi:uncharacterized protein LOC135097494 isoform X2 [Scylla paramamosain]|uniref:uncharacterized protein LOC135097494 isoform X2 n=1 Tax=Scylla paramamosain TaxID=85552 RepID=UPI003082DB28